MEGVDGDIEIVRKIGAALQPMVSWLERNGIDGGSLRPQGDTGAGDEK